MNSRGSMGLPGVVLRVGAAAGWRGPSPASGPVDEAVQVPSRPVSRSWPPSNARGEHRSAKVVAEAENKTGRKAIFPQK